MRNHKLRKNDFIFFALKRQKINKKKNMAELIFFIQSKFYVLSFKMLFMAFAKVNGELNGFFYGR